MELTDAPNQAFLDRTSSMTAEQMTQGYRRHNIRKLIAQSGLNQKQLSEKIGYSNSTFLGQMIGVAPIRNISEKTARKIEEVCNIEHLSLDTQVQFGADDLLPAEPHPSDVFDTAMANARRKYLRTDYSKYKDAAESPSFGFTTHIPLGSSTPPSEPSLKLDTVLELIEIVKSSASNLPAHKLFKILDMGLRDTANKSEIDRNFVQSLIDLIK